MLASAICFLPAAFADNCPAPAAQAFTGCYYGNTSLTGNAVFVRTDPQLNFNWGNGSPDPALPPGHFSARWQGYFAFSAGTYRFSATASDGIRLYVDGSVVLDRWLDEPAGTFVKSYDMSQGTHLITVEYFEETGSGILALTWQNAAPAAAAPVISSFTATPSAITPGQPVTLAWNVTGAAALNIDGIGDVSGVNAITLTPQQTVTYRLTASNSGGSSTAGVTVNVASAGNPQAPTAPTLLSATVAGSGEVDLAWTASTAAAGVAGYRILRNGTALATVPPSATAFADRTVAAGASYSYSLTAFDGAGLASAASNSLSVTTPAASSPAGTCPAPATGAFTGCYYSNPTLSGAPALVRTDPQINFYWGNSSPDASLAPLNFSARWQGNFTLSEGTYTFFATTSDGMRLYVDGNLIIDRWRNQPPYQYQANDAISQGTHLITVEYYEVSGGATAQVSWQNNSPASQAPVISSFTAAPAAVASGQAAVLAWSSTGASTLSIDNGVGDVTGRTTVTATPKQTTTYTLTASSIFGSSSARVTVTVAAAGDTQAPTSPVLVSATAVSGSEVDLTWTASTDNAGVAGYQILRNGSPITTVPGNALTFADRTVAPATGYSYAVAAYDAAGNYSAPGNALAVTTPATAGTVTVTWYGGCLQQATLYGVTGKFQAIDFSVTTATPLPLQGTLFDTANCDTSQGGDNLNDFGTLTGSTHMIQGFSHQPNVFPSSAYYWFGPRTADGKCPPGAPCSGCINYTAATVSCDALP